MTGKYIGASEQYKDCSVVIVGAPMDMTVSFRPGTRQGPVEIREVSEGLEEYSLQLNLNLSERRFYDAGDIILPFGNVNKCLNCISQVIHEIIKDKKIPFLLGGEHTVSLPAIKQVYSNYPDLAVIHLDAHADLRNDYLGEEFSHAAVIRRVAEVIGGKNIYQLGIRSGIREEFQWAENNTFIYPGEILEPLPDIVRNIEKRPVYISLDIDVVDPAYAPGTGTPEPGGCNSKEIIKALYLMKNLNIVGMDLVEVCPIYDYSQRTALLAAKLIREAILLFG
ncbi:MAG: agmatinase [Clostridiales bacterium]|nr:agmatinase [Clostridiales bacterium]MCF8021403.1 agmatinase [Clostridiales bacterium]